MKKIRRILIALTAIALVGAAIVFGIGKYREYSSINIPAEERPLAENPDFFLEQSLTTVYREDGKIDYQFNGEHLEHFKKSDTMQGKMVYFIFFDRDEHTWHARADKVVFLNKNKKIILSENVRIWQPARNLELTTDKITFNETREYAETDRPVTIKSPNDITRSIGMKLDLQHENLKLLSTVTGLYHVKK
jgi:lipopolysaccharide export system protein LptC